MEGDLYQSHRAQDAQARTQVVCGTDTVKYTIAKTQSTLYRYDHDMGSGTQGVSQYFDGASGLSIKGVVVFMNIDTPSTAASTPLTVKLTGATANHLPTNTVLATATYNLNNAGFGLTNINSRRRYIAFPSPVTVNGNYCVSVEFGTTQHTITSIVNDNGDNEGYAGRRSGNAWQTLLGLGQDVDFLIYPVVTIDYTDPTFTVTPPCLSGPGSVNFDLTYAPIADSRFYSVAAFYNSPEECHTWDHGDGNKVKDFSHTYYYNTVSTYNVTLRDTLFGWMRDCVSPVVTHVIGSEPAASFTHTITGGTVNFSNTSPGTITAYAWDFGDGGTSTTASPSHAYTTTGTFLVCLTVTTSCGTDEYCENITVVTSAVDPAQSAQLSILPNPSTGRIAVRSELSVNAAQIEVVNTLGQVVVRQSLAQLAAGQSLELNLSSLDKGIYFVHVSGEDFRAVQKLWLR